MKVLGSLFVPTQQNRELGAVGLDVVDNTAFVAGSKVLHAIDVTDRTNPTMKGKANIETDASYDGGVQVQ